MSGILMMASGVAWPAKPFHIQPVHSVVTEVMVSLRLTWLEALRTPGRPDNRAIPYCCPELGLGSILDDVSIVKKFTLDGILLSVFFVGFSFVRQCLVTIFLHPSDAVLSNLFNVVLPPLFYSGESFPFGFFGEISPSTRHNRD